MKVKVDADDLERLISVAYSEGLVPEAAARCGAALMKRYDEKQRKAAIKKEQAADPRTGKMVIWVTEDGRDLLPHPFGITCGDDCKLIEP